jgi:transcriptional regulator with XRE-family HTH domain
MCASVLTEPDGLILHMTAPPLKDRLREVMEAMAWTHRELMRVSGQSSSVVSQWLGSSTKEIKTIGKLEAAQAIERASGYSALWVAKGMGPKMAAQIDRTAMVLDLPADASPEREEILRQLSEWLPLLPASELLAVYNGVKNAAESAIAPSPAPGAGPASPLAARRGSSLRP